MNTKFIAFRIIPLSVLFVLLTNCSELYVEEVEDLEEPTITIETDLNEAPQEQLQTPSPNVDVVKETPAEQIALVVPEEDIVVIEDEEIAVESWMLKSESEFEKQSVINFCEEVGGKLGSVDVEDCLEQGLRFAGKYTAHNRPIAVRDFVPEGSVENKTRILIMGGIHGDEYSSISIMFKWMALLDEGPKSDFLWRFAPSVNPDGLLGGAAIRQNGNGVDLNRNFPSQDWEDKAKQYWENSTGSNPRRYPGEYAASEIEVQWIVEQIETFKPDVIMSIHAPYHLLDFDGPSEAPDRIGELYLHVLGVYPGSLGNYAGIDLGVPVVTLELPSAGIMPGDDEIQTMWEDIQAWLEQRKMTASR